MSRIGKKPIAVPSGVAVTLTGNTLTIKGPKGELVLVLHPEVSVEVAGSEIRVAVGESDVPRIRALWGLFRNLIQNMVIGVTDGFSKQLEVNGIGYRVEKRGNALALELGFSHPLQFEIPKGIEASVEKNLIVIRGADKQLVGETAARIRNLRPPEPYKGKGIKYQNEVVLRKAGKAVKGATA